MLAYVFWHWPKPDVDAAEYEQLQRAFHGALAQSAPSGFRASRTFRVTGQAGWLGGTPAYADWYLVDDSAALDPLNVAAVSGVCEAPHTQVAHAMSAGAGSLLGLRADRGLAQSPNLATIRHASWLTKPRDMRYAEFYAAVPRLPGADQTTLWRRQMVLGPTPEFALLSSHILPVPATYQPLTLTLNPI
ncbi:MAG: hypothetical protein JO057_12575 [Chloroflexi bacterium]|nr:hypothetical protein [Chloroflexota bacterium]